MRAQEVLLLAVQGHPDGAVTFTRELEDVEGKDAVATESV
jgi:hypothetical protein